MADRVSVAIRIGGFLPAALVDAFLGEIEADDARADWEGTPVTRDDLGGGQPLALVATEVAWGRFERIEDFCINHQLPFARWSGGAAGAFGPERVVFDGEVVRQFDVSEEDDVMVSGADVRALGSYRAILRRIEAADYAIPAFGVAPEVR